jgi:hypothetical protein
MIVSEQMALPLEAVIALMNGEEELCLMAWNGEEELCLMAWHSRRRGITLFLE